MLRTMTVVVGIGRQSDDAGQGRAGQGSLYGMNSSIIPPTISPADLNGWQIRLVDVFPGSRQKHTLFLANSRWAVHWFGPQGTSPGGAVSFAPLYGI